MTYKKQTRVAKKSGYAGYFFFVGETGLEPATPRTPCVYSSHLSYSPDLKIRNFA